MNFYINSPSYYTQEFGIIDEIYHLCRMISKNIDITLYTDALDTIGMTPIVAPQFVLDAGKCKEVKHISLAYRMASISLRSDYLKYLESDLTGKKQMILDNIFRSLEVIKKRLRNKFCYDRMVQDIKKLSLE